MKLALLLAAVLALPAASHAAKPSGSVALVTVESENRLLAIDVASGHVVRWWTLSADPENVEAYAGGAAVVSTSGAVTLINTDTLKVTHVVRGLGSPHIAAFAPGGDYVYVDRRRPRAARRDPQARCPPDLRRLWRAPPGLQP